MSLVFLKNIQDQAVKKKYKSPKMFRLEVDGAPKDLNFYIVDMSHTPTEFDVEDVRYGFKKLNYPGQSQQVDLTVTLRDSEDERLRTWLNVWSGLIDNGNGTSNPPSYYLKKVRRFRLGKSNPLSGKFGSSAQPEVDVPITSVDMNIGGYDFGSVSNLNQLPDDMAAEFAEYPQGRADSVMSKYVPPELAGVFNNLSYGRGISVSSTAFSPTGAGGTTSGFIETKTDEWMMWPSRIGEYNESREESGPLTFPVTFTGFRA